MIARNMDSIIEKSFDRPRSLLFGLLQLCLFPGDKKRNCPFLHLREEFTIEEKYNYVMKLSCEEVGDLLKVHEKCYEKSILAIMRD